MMIKQTERSESWKRPIFCLPARAPHDEQLCLPAPHPSCPPLAPAQTPSGELLHLYCQPHDVRGRPCSVAHVWVHDPSVAIPYTPLPWPQGVGQQWACDLGQTQNRKQETSVGSIRGRNSLSGKFWAWSCWSHHTDRLPKNEVNTEENQNWKIERDRCWKALCKHLDPVVPEHVRYMSP